MTFADKSRYDRTFQQVTHKGGEYEINYRTFQQVTHKGGEYAINYIKRFQNTHALSV